MKLKSNEPLSQKEKPAMKKSVIVKTDSEKKLIKSPSNDKTKNPFNVNTKEILNHYLHDEGPAFNPALTSIKEYQFKKSTRKYTMK